MFDVSTLELSNPDGSVVSLQEYKGKPLVVQLHRFYGWLPCVDYLMQLREIYPQILELGADAVAIGPKPAVMAQNQLDQGFPFALLMDPDHTVRKSLEVDQLSPAQLLKPQGLMNYAKSIGSWRSFGIEIDQATNRPGAFILDAEQNIAWSHIGDTLGDYPDTSEVIAQLTKLS